MPKTYIKWRILQQAMFDCQKIHTETTAAVPYWIGDFDQKWGWGPDIWYMYFLNGEKKLSTHPIWTPDFWTNPAAETWPFSDCLQVGRYQKGQFYQTHFDSEPLLGATAQWIMGDDWENILIPTDIPKAHAVEAKCWAPGIPGTCSSLSTSANMQSLYWNVIFDPPKFEPTLFSFRIRTGAVNLR